MGGAEFADVRRLPLHSAQLHPVLVLRLQLLRVEHRPSRGSAAAPLVVGPRGAQPVPRLHARYANCLKTRRACAVDALCASAHQSMRINTTAHAQIK
jgi:hypothetical protein